MQTSRMTSKGQVTIPKEIREQLGIKPGEMVEFSSGPGRSVTLRPRNKSVSVIFGILKDRPRKRKEPMSIEEMEEVIARERTKAAMAGLEK